MQSRDVHHTDDNKADLHLSQLASVGQIAAGIAHEVRNPLTAVKGFLQLMKENADEKYIDIAQTELEHALRTLENLLQVSKPDRDIEGNESIHLAVELESILQLFQDQIYRVKIHTDFRNRDQLIYGKRNQLKKAFFNLLKNAFEAIPGEGEISVSHYVSDRHVIVTIEDTGVGIPQDKLSLLSTPFFTTKPHGTGMGLTQVFSVIYQHGGDIRVESRENEGTRFAITIPLIRKKTAREVITIDLRYTDGQDLKSFFLDNRQEFENRLLEEAVNVRDKIEEIQTIGNINLTLNAHKLVLFLVDGQEHEIISFAKEEGEAWARFSLTLAFKLEWVQSIRRVLWDFLYNFDRLGQAKSSREQFYELEKNVNTLVDLFLSYFFMSYSKYKDELIRSHREMVEDLSVPIIPLSSSMSILPLIGTIDTFRADTIADKVITQIGTDRIQTLIMDLSGVAYMDTGVINHLIKVIDGVLMMGCRTVITGLRPEIVKAMIKMGISFDRNVEVKGTLQQALAEYMIRTPG